MLAAQARRPQLMRKLLECGAHVAAVDRAAHSTLWYASQAGSQASMTLLLPRSGFEANSIARKNGGSLREAARKLHEGAAMLLLKHNHDPNFPSKDHEGRSVLGEVCHGAVGTESAAQVRLVIEVLIDGPVKVDLESQRVALVKLLRQYRCSEKYYALEGAQPPDSEGAPIHIMEVDLQRRAQESVIQEHTRQHQLMLTHKREAADLNRTLSQQQH